MPLHRMQVQLTSARCPCLPFGVHGGKQDVAQSMAAFFQKVFMDQTTVDKQNIDQTSIAGGERPSMNPVELAGDIVSGTSTCKELGHQAFEFFKVNRVCM